MNNSQMLKGILSGVVLHVIAEGPIYGYELVTRLRKLGFTDITGGTVYPIVTKNGKSWSTYE
ncbi:PadR family transcriptional regulator,regulatory protein [Weissella confusa LBAE C39-2]|uniref:PadR family transcriptional regulator n=1 Tax=Weissella confusa TaxID=1583 RepID=UPI00024659AD|nr:PadR family transcriptional regulator,regulatory protein [Weissella confusa LBAE C39-2]